MIKREEKPMRKHRQVDKDPFMRRIDKRIEDTKKEADKLEKEIIQIQNRIRLLV